eukprot:CAMPEP_0203790120 /NCGR_PEP_ID=MMETSP0100_2-20121128/3866_1 /ASSEMBLY_ACC=CAM_ASM_000210 /TAXON_ID=96639 /ORGANISM=" , Strain NY0313808BC1" /LENGTH=350 /DNA_ID=CAMNT_0050693219 /DNA_START=970 /DNA_END=2018 /DNA_ORIENTATION=+
MQRIASGSDDTFVKLWDVETGSIQSTYDDHTAAVRSVRFDPLSGLCLASAGDDGAINLFDVRSNQLIQHYTVKDKSAVSSIRFHPTGNYLVSGSDDAAARIWDLREGRLLYSICAHTKGISGVDFSADGEHFVSGSSDGLVLAWQSRGLCEDDTPPPPQHQVQDEAEDDAQTDEALYAPKPKRRSHSKHKRSRRSSSHHHRHGRKHSHHRSNQGGRDEQDDELVPIQAPPLEQETSQPQDEQATAGSRERRSQPTAPVRQTSTASSIGEYTRSAARASMLKRFNKSDEDTELNKSRASSGSQGRPRPPPPPSPGGSNSIASQQQDYINRLTRAMHNLEKRLRMNEDAVAA